MTARAADVLNIMDINLIDAGDDGCGGGSGEALALAGGVSSSVTSATANRLVMHATSINARPSSILHPQRTVYRRIFTARRYASAAYGVVVCLSVRLSHSGIVLKRLNLGSLKQYHTIDPEV